MRRLTLLIVLALLVAGQAHALNEGRWPATAFDSPCTDSFDTPTAAKLGPVSPKVQISGSADTFCDHDSRIVADPITVDTTFGPFTMPRGLRALVVYVDADTILPTAASTWNIRIRERLPHDNSFRAVQAVPDETSEGDKVFLFAPSGFTYGAVTATVVGDVPELFYIELNLTTATSFDGSLSWKAF